MAIYRRPGTNPPLPLVAVLAKANGNVIAAIRKNFTSISYSPSNISNLRLVFILPSYQSSEENTTDTLN
jgi:hypothetical protein